MKKIILAAVFLTSVSGFASDCSKEIANFNDAMKELKAYVDGTVEYLTESAAYVENYGNYINGLAGQKLSAGQGQNLVASASMIRANTNTIAITGKDRREKIITTVQAIIDCKATVEPVKP